jgi:Tol biopolymer transport system component
MVAVSRIRRWLTGEAKVWLRSLDQEQPRLLAGTERAEQFLWWSPDSRSVAFFADGVVKRIDLDSGFVRTVAPAPNANRGAWSDQGIILFGASAGPLSRVSAQGGAVQAATALLTGQSSHRWPHFLPDGRHFIFLALGLPDVRGLYLGSLDSTNITRVMEGEYGFAIMPPSHLLLAHQGALWAQKLKPDYTGIEGTMQPVASRVLSQLSVNALTALSTSSTGSVAYRSAAASRQLAWFDRSGREVEAVTAPDDTQWSNVRASRDGLMLTAGRQLNGNTDVWVVDTTRTTPRRLTFETAVDGEAMISPDGRRVIYASDPGAGLWDIYERPSDGTGSPTLLLNATENESPRDLTSDGKYLVYARQSPKTDYDIWAVPLTGERKPFPIVQTPFAEIDARLSPDGRVIAFDSNETGRREIFVQPFPGPGPRVQISSAGGSLPRWRRDGKELYYIGPDAMLMSTPVDLTRNPLTTGSAQALFRVPLNDWYEPSGDGQRFLIIKTVSDPPPVTILLNWKPK